MPIGPARRCAKTLTRASRLAPRNLNEMNRTVVQRNLRAALLVGGLAAFAFFAAFIVTAIWIG